MRAIFSNFQWKLSSLLLGNGVEKKVKRFCKVPSQRVSVLSIPFPRHGMELVAQAYTAAVMIMMGTLLMKNDEIVWLYA